MSRGRILKRFFVGVAATAGVSIVMVGIMLLTDFLQTARDYAVLSRFATSKQTALMGFADTQQPVRQQVICQPARSRPTHCPALLYRISEENCLRAQLSVGINKTWCGDNIGVTFNGRPIEVRFGQVYEMDDGYFYLQFVMNEQNLLSAIGVNFW